jgi:hypothetical protein
MLLISFALLLGINGLQRWSGGRSETEAPEEPAMRPAFGVGG